MVKEDLEKKDSIYAGGKIPQVVSWPWDRTFLLFNFPFLERELIRAAHDLCRKFIKDSSFRCNRYFQMKFEFSSLPPWWLNESHLWGKQNYHKPWILHGAPLFFPLFFLFNKIKKELLLVPMRWRNLLIDHRLNIRMFKILRTKIF